MSRHKDGAVVKGLCECHARQLGISEQGEPGVGAHVPGIDFCVAGCRHGEKVVKAAQQRLGGRDEPGVVDAGELAGDLVLGDAVQVVKPCHRAPADVERAEYVAVGIVHDAAQLLPVVHLLKGQLLHRRAGDNHAVEFLAEDVVGGKIEAAQMRGGCVLGDMTRYLHERDVYLQRRVGEHPEQLRLGHFFGGHQVDDGNFQRADILGRSALAGHDKNVLPFQRRVCRQIRINPNGHRFLLRAPLPESSRRRPCYQTVRKAELRAGLA